MDCFEHEGRAAVGTCRSCGKGVCRSCAVDLGRGLACAGRCEPHVRAVIAMLEQSARIQSLSGGMLSATRTLWRGVSWVSLLVGVFVVVWALRLPAYREISLLGVPFLVLGFITWRVARRARATGLGAPSSTA